MLHDIPKSWLDYVPHENIQVDYNDMVFRCLNLNPELVKVVIVGLSPYPNLRDRSGLAFATPDKRTYNDLPFSLKVLTWKLYGEYGVRRDSGLLDSRLLGWERQGILLYNVSLTCQPQQPLSDIQMWNNFSTSLLNNLDDDVIIWTLGRHARETVKGDFHSVHPAALAYNKKLEFKSYFKQIASLYEQRFNRPLDWFLNVESCQTGVTTV